MLKQSLAVMATLSIMVPAAALACGEDKQTMAMVTLEQAQKAKASFVDVNGKDTRKKWGVIPGAILLTSYDAYVAKTELPKDKNEKLVFYCANEKCSASKVAAKRAMKSGYTDVAVLPDGIMGWKKAGYPIKSDDKRS